MVVRTCLKLLIGIILTVMVSVLYAEEELEIWNLRNNNTNQSDYLVYELKYRGLFTLFIWKNLADVVFISSPANEEFEGNKSCQLIMKLSTEKYSFAESTYPYRYQWRSKVSPDLSKVFLVEEIGKGKKEEYNVRILDWENQNIDLFRQRQLITPEEDVFAEEDEGAFFSGEEKEKPKPYWEKDGKKPVPAYFNHLPKREEQYDYLVYDKSVEFEQNSDIVDPLGVIYSARWFNAASSSEQILNVSYKDEIREYRLEVLGDEIIEIGAQQIPAIKLNIMRRNKNEAEEEGFIVLWVSDDTRRLPLKYEIEVPLGKIHVVLTEKSLQEYKMPHSCLSVAHGVVSGVK